MSSRKSNKTPAGTATVELKGEISPDGRGFMAISGWHQNYNEFTDEEKNLSGTIVYVNGNLNIVLNHKASYTIDLSPVIQAAIEHFCKEVKR